MAKVRPEHTPAAAAHKLTPMLANRLIPPAVAPAPTHHRCTTFHPAAFLNTPPPARHRKDGPERGARDDGAIKRRKDELEPGELEPGEIDYEPPSRSGMRGGARAIAATAPSPRSPRACLRPFQLSRSRPRASQGPRAWVRVEEVEARCATQTGRHQTAAARAAAALRPDLASRPGGPAHPTTVDHHHAKTSAQMATSFQHHLNGLGPQFIHQRSQFAIRKFFEITQELHPIK